jgi:hypothetical protein
MHKTFQGITQNQKARANKFRGCREKRRGGTVNISSTVMQLDVGIEIDYIVGLYVGSRLEGLNYELDQTRDARRRRRRWPWSWSGPRAEKGGDNRPDRNHKMLCVFKNSLPLCNYAITQLPSTLPWFEWMILARRSEIGSRNSAVGSRQSGLGDRVCTRRRWSRRHSPDKAEAAICLLRLNSNRLRLKCECVSCGVMSAFQGTSAIINYNQQQSTIISNYDHSLAVLCIPMIMIMDALRRNRSRRGSGGLTS